MSKRILCLVLGVLMVLACLAGCKKDENPETVPPVDPYAGKTHQEISDALYSSVLGEFSRLYAEAKAATNVSERFAKMAIAEAKLLSSGVMLPSTANGGNYAISRVAPYSVSTVLWGNDSDRFYTALIASGNPLTSAERDELKALWAAKAGTGTYLAEAKAWFATKGYALNTTYALGYSSDPQTWDAVATSMAADSEAIVNTYDGLLEYNAENIQVPALATGYTVSPDGLTYTFTIRQGVKWVNYQGTEIEEVTADSFVAGFQHMLDAKGGLEYLVEGIVKNASEYIAGEVTDFAQVGCKVGSNPYELVYTLEAPCTYFTTMLGYNVFAPISRSFFTTKGGAFGVEAFAALTAEGSTANYTYGTSFENIAYCGPYLVKSATAENSIVFEQNPNYWNKTAMNITKIEWKFISGQDPKESYTLMKHNIFAGAGLTSEALQQAKTDGLFETYGYVSGTDATSFPVFFNLYRAQYANFNDETVAVSQMSEAAKVRTNIAMQNKNFRLALATDLDRGAYNAATVGDELKLTSLVNSYTPGNFVKLDEEVTVKINGTDKTYPVGTYYGKIMQDQLDADGIKVKVWDPAADNGIGSSSGYDGWYNVDYSRERLAAAVTELQAQGIEVTADNPIYLELPYYDVNQTYTNRANALKQSIEASTQGLIKVNLIACGGSNALNWYNAAYYPATGDDMNYHISDVSGWGPDYGDPQTYLDTMLQTGYMIKCLGLY